MWTIFKVKVLVTQSCPVLCEPMDCSSPGSSVHGILQARILEWVIISFSRGSSQLRAWNYISTLAGRFFITEPLGSPVGRRAYPNPRWSHLEIFKWHIQRLFFQMMSQSQVQNDISLGRTPLNPPFPWRSRTQEKNVLGKLWWVLLFICCDWGVCGFWLAVSGRWVDSVSRSVMSDSLRPHGL